MNAKMLQEIDFSLLESFISHARPVLEQDLPDPDKIFALDGPFLATLLQDRGDVSSVISVLQNLKALSRSLSVLSRIVREGTISMRSGVFPIICRRGLQALPIETVVQIFEGVFASDTGACTSLSLVNKDFRNIALQTPQLWTHLTNENYPKHYLERSKSLGIDIKFLSGKRSIPDRTRKFFQMVAPHSSRWRSFSISGFRNTSRDIFSGLAILSSVNTFSALETLHVDYKYDVLLGDDGVVVENEQDPDKDLKHFFNTWKMPALRTVNTVNLIPMLPATSVTCFRFDLIESYEDGYPERRMHEITGLLRSLHSLTELSIVLVKITFEMDSEATCVELPLLRKLKLRTDPGYELLVDSPLKEVVEAISTPNVTELTIHINAFKLGWQLGVLFPEDELRWSCVESLDLELYRGDWYDDDDIDEALDVAFSRLPARLQHLRVSCDWFSPPSTFNVHEREQGESPYPPLRTLRLEKLLGLNASFISSIKDIINAPVFESLEMDDCSFEMDKEIVWNMLPKDKVSMYKCTYRRMCFLSYLSTHTHSLAIRSG
ncbi:hypothetical protein M0805_007784 [Coniferiporia weirii]|nr:hypothetical protein M0805_007784 [Coniferiporia weirii]